MICFPTDPESGESKEQVQERIGNELLETTDFFLQGTHPESQQSVPQAGSRPAHVTGKCSLFPQGSPEPDSAPSLAHSESFTVKFWNSVQLLAHVFACSVL